MDALFQIGMDTQPIENNDGETRLTKKQDAMLIKTGYYPDDPALTQIFPDRGNKFPPQSPAADGHTIMPAHLK